MFAGIGKLMVSILTTLLGAFTTMTLWMWFGVPLGLPQIGMAHAVGISLLVSNFKTLPNINEKKPDESFGEVILKTIVANLFFLAFGWVVLQFMPK
jgi:hypothetical protein